MTTDEALQAIHVLLEKDTNYPSSDEEDYGVRLALVNQAIRTWETEEGMLWNELFVSLADSEDEGADKETVATQADYSCPSDFRFPVGYLRIGSVPTYYNLIRPENIQIYDGNTSSYFWHVTGNARVGYTYHINPIPSESEHAIQFEYYKSAAMMEDGDDVLEMSDPQFAVYWVLGELVKEEDPGLAQNYLDVALSKLKAMKTKNLMAAHWQDNQIDDYFQGYVFGR